MSRAPVLNAAAAALVGQLLLLGPTSDGELRLTDWDLSLSAGDASIAKAVAAGQGASPWYPESVDLIWSPAWTTLLTLGATVGIDPTSLGALLTHLFSAVAVVAVGLLAVRIQGRTPPGPALLAPWFLATSQPFIASAASGMGSPLLQAAFAIALLGTIGERRWAPLAWLAVSVCEPIGMGLAAIAAGHSLAQGAARRPWLTGWAAPLLAFMTTRWLVLGPASWFDELRLPWGLHGGHEVSTFSIDRGLHYIADGVGLGVFALPLLLAGAGASRRSITTLSALTGVWVLQQQNMLIDADALTVVGLLGLYGAAVWAAQRRLWVLLLAPPLLSMLNGGSWINGHMLFGSAAIPVAILLSVGSERLLMGLQKHMPPRLAATLVLLIATVICVRQVEAGAAFAEVRETGTRSIVTRVEYVDDLMTTLGVTDPVVADVDIDVFQLHRDWTLIDITGTSHPEVQSTSFVADVHALLAERSPHYIHIHGGWASRTRLTDTDWLTDNYVEVAPYGHKPHPGNWVRRDLLEAHPGAIELR